jgi:hypothetical protein
MHEAGFDDYGMDHDGVPDDVDGDGIDDGTDGECELRWNWQKLESAGAKMIIWMMVSMMAFHDDGLGDLVDAVIVPMKMASVTTYGFDDYGIDHDGVPDEYIDDEYIDDGIDRECELRWNRHKLESAGAKTIIWMMVSMSPASGKPSVHCRK